MESDEVDTTPTGDGDADLVLRARSGDGEAYAELWRRHYRSGITVARSITSSLDPDDLVQEAYARIYQSIRRGGGPTGSFRAYLFTSIRNTAAGGG
ncbi:RNA polymerase sigma factor, partial [Microbacterium sp. C448]|uniref:RNA polymerase sigma factor n=1 Tax=Microbacterium sp. C448 TaxID=1177594 RepID=UPI0005636CEF